MPAHLAALIPGGPTIQNLSHGPTRLDSLRYRKVIASSDNLPRMEAQRAQYCTMSTGANLPNALDVALQHYARHGLHGPQA